MANVNGEWRWTYADEQRHWVPDHRVLRLRANETAAPLRGDACTLGVVEDATGKFVGWIRAADLGYPDVKAWIAATGWRQAAGPRGGKFRGFVSEGPRFAVEARAGGGWARKGEYRTRALAIAAARAGWGGDARVLDPAGAVAWPAAGGKRRAAGSGDGGDGGDLTADEMRRRLKPILAWMGRNLHQWAVVDTLKDFTAWGFWSQRGGEVMASIDGETAGRVLRHLRAFVRDEAPDRDVVEVWDRLYHYEAHARPGGKRRAEFPPLYGAYTLIDGGRPVVRLVTPSGAAVGGFTGPRALAAAKRAAVRRERRTHEGARALPRVRAQLTRLERLAARLNAETR